MSSKTIIAMGGEPEPEKPFNVEKAYSDHKGKYRQALQSSHDVVAGANVQLVTRLTNAMHQVVNS